MTVLLSRALIKKLIIQEMRLSAPSRHSLTSSMSANDDITKTLDIDDETEIDDIPSFMDNFNDKTMFDFDGDIEDFGIEMDIDDEGKNKRSRAEMAYDDLVKQGRETEMADPEFMQTNDLDDIDQHTLELPSDRSRKQLREAIRKEIRQSIKRRLL